MAYAKILILIFLLLVLSSVDALADFKGLLLLGDLNQSVVLDYNYSRSENIPKNGSSASTSQHRFTETYNAGIEYSLLHPYVLNGHIKGSFGLDQATYSSPDASSTSNGTSHAYDIDGIFFKISPTPINFSVRSETLFIQTPFTPGYDVTTDSYGVGASFNHKLLGLRLDYSNTTSETSGTTNDTRQEISLFSLKADNVYKNSATEVQITNTTSRLDPLAPVVNGVSNYKSYSLSGKNTLISSQQDKSLSSNVSYREERQTDTTQRDTTKTLTLGETFNWQLGKALAFDARYENSSVSTTGLLGVSTSDTMQQIGSVSLTHQLYNSLTSRLKVQGRRNDLDVGRETEYTGSANFLYTKKLSAADTLTLNYAEEYSVIDRNLTSGTLTANAEPLTVQTIQYPAPGENRLQQPYVISVISVCDQANPLNCYGPRNYDIVRDGPYSRLDFSKIGSLITVGQRLLVTYLYQVDANESYRRSSHGGGGAITFLEGIYQLYANMSQSSQDITSGQQGILRPSSSLDYTIGATRNTNGVYANIVYVNSKSSTVNYQYIEETLRLTRYFEGSSLNAQLKDRQTWYGESSYYTAAYSQNQLSLSADYTRNVFSNAVLTLRTSYFLIVDQSQTRNDVILESIYRWGFGKLFLEARGRFQFRDIDGNSVTDMQAHLRITRTF